MATVATAAVVVNEAVLLTVAGESLRLTKIVCAPATGVVIVKE